MNTANTAHARPLRLRTARDVLADPDSSATAVAAVRWAGGYLTRPHPDLGRSGPVCPYVRTAIDRDTMWLTEVSGADLDATGLHAALDEARDTFGRLAPRERPAAEFKTVLLVFPDLDAQASGSRLGELLRQAKPAFVAAGLMLGPVFPDNPMPGAHNPGFRPMAGPVSLIAIRLLMPSDLPFLDRPQDSPAVRREYVRAYLDHLGPTISVTRRASATAVLDRLGPHQPMADRGSP